MNNKLNFESATASIEWIFVFCIFNKSRMFVKFLFFIGFDFILISLISHIWWYTTSIFPVFVYVGFIFYFFCLCVWSLVWSIVFLRAWIFIRNTNQKQMFRFFFQREDKKKTKTNNETIINEQFSMANENHRFVLTL